jgi:hypothetical protein
MPRSRPRLAGPAHSSRLAASLTAAAIVSLAAPQSSHAQSAGRGYLFGKPIGSFTLRGGYALANAKSDLFAFTTEELTLDRRDFSSPGADAEFALHALPKTDLVLWSSWAGVRRPSEFRNFIDNNDQPIEQTTDFQRVPVTVGIKQYLVSPGRSIGRFAWVPARVAPYVSAGAGTMWYRFKQTGDFVDFKTNDVFASVYESTGWTTAAHGAAGLEYSLDARFALSAETRYLWSKATLSPDFSGFDRLDLSGLSTMLGFTVRF